MTMTVPAPARAAARATRSLPLIALALAFAGVPAGAQSVDLLVSTSADADLAGVTVRDEDLLAHGPSGVTTLALPGETLSALAGDPNDSGLHLAFGDVDAVHLASAALVSDGLFVSLLSNENGFLDGDVLRVSAAGVEVFVSEADFALATGSVDGNLDVDAIQIDADGTLVFSFAEDEDSTTLSGDQPGVIRDGDVLVWLAGASAAQILYTESQIDALVTAALGANTSTGDTRGLARDPSDGALLFCVQSPSAHDASVFSTAGGGTLLAGHDEASFGFGGDSELDALTVLAARWPALSVSDPRPAAGGAFSFALQDGVPGEPHAVLMALALGPTWLSLPGWGGLVLADDPLFTASAALLPSLTAVADGAGGTSWALDVPPSLTALDVVAQVVRLGSAPAAGNPIVIEFAQ